MNHQDKRKKNLTSPVSPEYIEEVSRSFNEKIQYLHLLNNVTYNEIADFSDISKSSVRNGYLTGNITLSTYLKLLLSHLKLMRYHFDYIRLNQSVIHCIKNKKHLVLLELDDEELKDYSAPAVLMKKTE